MGVQVREAAAFIRKVTPVEPKVAIILGSGLGALADRVTQPLRLTYREIPYFPVSRVPGHAGVLVIGLLEDVPVAVMSGRAHYYEGYSLQEVTLPVRAMRRLGAEVIIVTNAAGGLDPSFVPGDLMLITDHLNLMGLAGLNPLVGIDEQEFGNRFVDLLDAYDPDLRSIAQDVAVGLHLGLREGVYAMVSGPSYETRAELAFLQQAGAKAVGMSTVPEVIVARHEGMRVVGISTITDVVVGPKATKGVSHSEVLAVAQAAGPRLASLVSGIVSRLR